MRSVFARRLAVQSPRAVPLIAAAALACAGDPAMTAPERAHPITPADPPASVSLEPQFAYAGQRLGFPAAGELVNVNGSPRITDVEAYDRFRADIAPLVEQWGADSRLAINPNFVAAVLTKESGFDPRAVSGMPANGYPQLTHIADLDLREMVTAPAFAWMRSEVDGWARHPLVHSPDATRERTIALLAEGAVTASNEYFFHPPLATRGAMFWLRLLANKWTTDGWPGEYGSFARSALNGGAPLSDGQLLDLVAVSYNRGYPWVHEMIVRHGPAWVSRLADQGAHGVQAADYLERVRFYTALFQRAAR